VAAPGARPPARQLPSSLSGINTIVNRRRQAVPPFRTTRLYTRLTAAAVRRQLIAHTGDTADVWPTVPTITAQLHALGDDPQTVATSPPQTKSQQPRRSSPK